MKHHEKGLRNNWECGTDYLNEEADFGDGRKKGVRCIMSCMHMRAVRHV